MGQRIELIFPAPPNRSQDTGNHWKRAKLKKIYYDECFVALLSYRLPKEKVWQAILWKAHLEVGNRMDADNLMACMKWPLDYLKDQGPLVSDAWNHCWPSQVPTQELKRKTPRNLFLTIDVIS